jgi:hypothetical protein
MSMLTPAIFKSCIRLLSYAYIAGLIGFFSMFMFGSEVITVKII